MADEGTAALLEFQGKGNLIIEAGEMRRWSNWQEPSVHADAIGGIALSQKAYKKAVAAGRTARARPFVQKLLADDSGDIWTETSICANHSTGLSINTRPDFYMPKSSLMLDFKKK